MAEDEQRKSCEKCDRETPHLIEQVQPDNSVHYVCWACATRGEKRFITKDTWRRSRRGQTSSN